MVVPRPSAADLLGRNRQLVAAATSLRYDRSLLSVMSIVALQLVLLLLLLLCAVPPSSGQYNVTAYSPFVAPFGVCVDRSGGLYIADTGNRRIVRLSSAGQLLATFTTSSPQLDLVTGVALSSDDSVLYVADQGNGRLIALDAQTGAFLFTFLGAFFNQPYQPAVDEQDNVYVSDIANVWMFNSSGPLFRQYGSFNLSTSVDALEGVAVSPSGDTLFVADSTSNAVLVVDGSSGLITSVLQTSSPPSLRSPSALAYSEPLNVLYAADTANNRVVQFNLTSNSSSAWNVTLLNPRGLALDSNGAVYVTDTQNNHIVKLAADVDGLQQFYGDNGLGAGQNGWEGVAVDRSGSVYVSDPFNNRSTQTERQHRCIMSLQQQHRAVGHMSLTFICCARPMLRIAVRVRRLSVDGTVTTVNADGALNTPLGLAVDVLDSVYVADSKNGRIVKFSSSIGDLRLNMSYSNTSAYPSPYGVAVDATGNLYITDSQQLSVVVVSPTGAVLSIIRPNPSFISPCSIVLDSDNNIYVADDDLNAVLKLAPNGTVLLRTADGLLIQAKGVALDQQGNMWIADDGAGAVKQLSSDGSLLSTTVSSNYPYAIALDPTSSGTFYSVGFKGVLIFRPCAAGYYCPPEQTAPVACPASTYNNRTMQLNSSACLPCTANVSSSLCPTLALSSTASASSAASPTPSSTSTIRIVPFSSSSSGGSGGTSSSGLATSIIIVIAVVGACLCVLVAAFLKLAWNRKADSATSPLSPGNDPQLQQLQLDTDHSSGEVSFARVDIGGVSPSSRSSTSLHSSDTHSSFDSSYSPTNRQDHHSPSPAALPLFESGSSLPFGVIPWSDLELYVDRPPLGRGGCGSVVLARWKSRHEVVAVKVLHSQDKGGDTEQRQFLREFHREVGLMYHLKGERRVVSMRGACLEPGHECIVMEYLENGNLFHFLKTDKGRRLSWPERTRLAFEAVQAINYLHLYALGPIYHADIKSLNFLLDKHYSLKVADFGLSRVKQALNRVSTASTAAGLPTEQQGAGTLQWTAPELMVHRDRPAYNAACDVFSLGVVLWELATNEEPWKDEDRSMIPSWLLHQRLRLPIPEHVPHYFREWIELCWQHEPAKRPTCAELLDRITEQLPALRGESTTASTRAAASSHLQHNSDTQQRVNSGDLEANQQQRHAAAALQPATLDSTDSGDHNKNNNNSNHLHSRDRDRLAGLATV